MGDRTTDRGIIERGEVIAEGDGLFFAMTATEREVDSGTATVGEGAIGVTSTGATTGDAAIAAAGNAEVGVGAAAALSAVAREGAAEGVALGAEAGAPPIFAAKPFSTRVF